MKTAVISFTRKGAEKSIQLKQLFMSMNCSVTGYTMPSFCCDGLMPIEQTLSQWMKTTFEKNMPDLFVFVSAAGIAIRAIHPFVKDKMTDPAVVVMDEKANFVIPVLSGHMGGANFWAKKIAQFFCAIPVITTATDVNDTFAVDLFAKKNELIFEDRVVAKKISAELLDGKTVGIKSAFTIKGELPEGLAVNEPAKTMMEITFRTDCKKDTDTLVLIPKCISIGIGCKRGTSAEKIEKFIRTVLDTNHIDRKAVEKIATIDLKKEEEGIINFAEKTGIKMEVYSSAELNALEGEFSYSEFVEKITGVGNVCERAAVLAASDQDRQGILIVHKTSAEGMTAAVAYRNKTLTFTF